MTQPKSKLSSLFKLEYPQSVGVYNTYDEAQKAVDYLADHPATTGDGIGVVGFCMGGMLTFVLAAERPDRVTAAVPFYGFPIRPRTENNPILAIDDEEVARVDSPMLAFWGDQDSGVGMDNVAAYDDKLTAQVRWVRDGRFGISFTGSETEERNEDGPRDE